MIKEGAMIGAIVGLIVVGARAFYAFLNYRPDSSGMFNFSLYGLFAEAPFIWMILGLPFGAMVGIIIGVTFNYLTQYGLLRWPIANTILGAILGWLVTLALFKGSEYLVWETRISWGIILGVILVYLQAFSFLQIPGAIIGGVVGLLLRRNGWWLFGGS